MWSGAATFSQVLFVSSGAGPRSGNEAGFDMAESVCGWEAGCGAHPKRIKASSPNINLFTVSLLDAFILRELPYEKITLS
jgi:hypothetical protein